MSPLLLPVLAVLAAGALHAVWNAIAKAVPDRYAGMALIGAAQAGAGLAAALFVAPPAPAAWPWLAASIPMQVGYLVLLARCYELGDFGQVYPLARGSAPLIVALVAATTLGEHLSPAQLVGLAAICTGLVALAFAGRIPLARPLNPSGPRSVEGGGGAGSGGPGWRAVGAALLTGATIAAYTLVDGVGVRHAGGAAGYAAWSFGFEGPLALAVVFGMRGRSVGAGMRAYWRFGLIGGLIAATAYSIVLWAQTKAALATVAALRETGVIVGVAIGSLFFAEPMGRRRIAAAGAVVLGVVLINTPRVR